MTALRHSATDWPPGLSHEVWVNYRQDLIESLGDALCGSGTGPSKEELAAFEQASAQALGALGEAREIERNPMETLLADGGEKSSFIVFALALAKNPKNAAAMEAQGLATRRLDSL